MTETVADELLAVPVERVPVMFSIAYRMLGSASEAEDVVQEAFLRLHRMASPGRGTKAAQKKKEMSEGQ